MNYDTEKVDEAVLALLYMGFHQDGPVTRAWKGMDWEAMDRLHAKGLISDPKSKARSVVMTEEGKALAHELFLKLFGA
jgi:hypothetical protein